MEEKNPRAPKEERKGRKLGEVVSTRRLQVSDTAERTLKIAQDMAQGGGSGP